MIWSAFMKNDRPFFSFVMFLHFQISTSAKFSGSAARSVLIWSDRFNARVERGTSISTDAIAKGQVGQLSFWCPGCLECCSIWSPAFRSVIFLPNFLACGKIFKFNFFLNLVQCSKWNFHWSFKKNAIILLSKNKALKLSREAEVHFTKLQILALDFPFCLSSGGRGSLIFSNRIDVRRLSLDLSQYTTIVSSRHNTIAVDYHFTRSQIFYSDITTDAIYSAFLNGTDLKTIISVGTPSPGGLAVDWQNNLLYWTDSSNGRIEVSSLDGAKRRVVISDFVEKPRAIVVDPCRG